MKSAASFLIFCATLIGAAFAAPHTAQAFDTSAKFAILMDYETGDVLWGKNEDETMYPASMSKLMTLDVLFGAIREGSVSLEDEFIISEYAWRTGGAASGSSTMFADLNSSVPVKALLKSIIIQSGNDACIAVAEALSGSEEAFAIRMTERGKQIGLTNSVY
ncbi:MAG: serine hydrolase, partial [Parvibaculum sp.]